MTKPHLELRLDVGWIIIQTCLMYRRYERDTFEYISLRWKLFKWNGEFALYTIRKI